MALASLFGVVELIGNRWVHLTVLDLSSLSMWVVVAMSLVALSALIGYTLLVVALLDAPLLRFAIPCILLVPIIAVAVVLPYLGKPRLYLFLAFAFFDEALIAGLGAALPVEYIFPKALHFFLYAGSSAAASFLIFLLLVQFRARLQTALREERAAVQMRDEFLSLAAHELRTPLTPLRLHLNTLLRVSPTSSDVQEVRERLAKVDKQVARLTRLVNDLLDVSRIHSGQLSFAPEEVDYVYLANETVGSLAEEAKRAGSPISLVTSLETIAGVSDPNRLEQILLNLLSNALKYGGGKPIELSLNAIGESITFEVQDSGIGISEEDQYRLFQRFERAVPARSYRGLGLGLWITRQIVAALGGTISVKSALGVGSTFTVELPRGCRA